MMKYGYGNQEIIDAAKNFGFTPQQYREHLHKSFYQKQREYNRIVDQCHIQDIKPKYIIDSFSDNAGNLKLLDSVEIDLKKRIASSSFLSSCRLLTENDTYRFYRCDFSMLREEKSSGNVVYFAHSGSPACIYHDKLYWFNYGSILSDKYISRCNIIDGAQQESLSWLSNEKTGETIGHSYHIVSEDSVTEMRVENDSLIIIVKRKSIKNAEYMIKVKEIGKIIHVSKNILSGDFSSCKDISTFE